MSDRPRPMQVGEELPPMEPTLEPRQARAGSSGKRSRQTPNASEPTMGRFGTFNSFVDCSMAELSRAELAVWLVLFRDCRDGIAATAQPAIAKRAGCNARTVRRALHELERRGLVEIVHRGGLGRGISRYRVRGAAVD